jgi:hypothetical protein
MLSASAYLQATVTSEARLAALARFGGRFSPRLALVANKTRFTVGFRLSPATQPHRTHSNYYLSLYNTVYLCIYWIVRADSSASAVSTFDNSLLQESASRLHRLEQLHRDERERLAGRQKVTNETGSRDMALNTNWMRRNGWAETFAGADRKLLVQLAQIPRATEKDLALGVYNGVPMHSRREDEFKLSHLVTALDEVFDRCEDTVRHTDVSIRCLLRSSYPDRTYKAPFKLVGRKATTEGYRRQFKKALCFCVRF